MKYVISMRFQHLRNCLVFVYTVSAKFKNNLNAILVNNY